jgi:para-nitrobenzyl esterase
MREGLPPTSPHLSPPHILLALLVGFAIGCGTGLSNPLPPPAAKGDLGASDIDKKHLRAPESFDQKPSVCERPVDTRQGKVTGQVGAKGVCQWLGIQYAVVKERWTAPSSPSLHELPVLATGFGPRCPQQSVMDMLSPDQTETSERQCLNLNIWRPESDAKGLPVLVYIHGGGNVGGSGSSTATLGSDLVHQNLIVVTFNYRLGIFGFFAHPQLPSDTISNSAGNFGLLDQLAALRWIKQNIAGFGGDPSRITVVGNGDGGSDLCALVASPRAVGLFSRAVLQGADCRHVTTVKEGLSQSAELASALECAAEDLACMRSAPASRVLAKSTALAAKRRLWQSLPFVDGDVVPQVPLERLEQVDDVARIPILIGHDGAHGGFVHSLFRALDTKSGSAIDRIAEQLALLDEQKKRFTALYGLDRLTGLALHDAIDRALWDAIIGCPAHQAASALSLTTQTFAYQLALGVRSPRTLVSELPEGLNMLEVPLLFGTFGKAPFHLLFPHDQEQQHTAIVWRQMVLSFVRGESHSALVPFSKAGSVLFTGSSMRLHTDEETNHVETRCEFWRGYSDSKHVRKQLTSSAF